MLQCELSDLCVEDLEIWHVWLVGRATKHVGDSFQHMPFPFRDLAGMYANVCGQLRQCLAAFDGRSGHLGLKGCPVIASRSLHRLAPLVRPPSGASGKPGYHLAHCPNFRGPLYAPGTDA